MGKGKIVGSTLLSNIKSKRIDLEVENVEDYEIETKSLNETEDIDIEICEKEIDIKDYMDKPIELLMKDANISADYFTETSTEEEDNSIIDIEYVCSEEEFSDQDVTEAIFYDMDKLEAFSRSESDTEAEILSMLSSLEEKVKYSEKALQEKEMQIDYLRKQNLGLQKTLMREQDIVMKEQDLQNKTLSKVEKLLLDKREELMQRQRASKRSWFLKILDKVKS